MIISALAVLPVASGAEVSVTPYTEGEQTASEPVGAGTALDPYRIYTAEQLAVYSQRVAADPTSSAKLMADIVYNGGVKFEADVDTGLVLVKRDGEVYYLGSGVKGFPIEGGSTQFDTAPSNMGSWYLYDSDSDSYSQTDTAPITLTATAPIDSGASVFLGSFDGQDYKISGLYMNTSLGSIGCFANLGSGAVVKNLTVADSLFLSSGSNVGAIAGTMNASEAKHVSISGCTNDGCVVVAGTRGGGIVGSQNAEANMQGYVNVNDSVNHGDVMVSGSYAGGIMGSSSRGSVGAGAFGLTANFGTVYAASSYAGGITPQLVNGNGIERCFNAGDVYATSYAAGIAAVSNRNVRRCINTGNINAVNYASGIVGFHRESNVVSHCGNIGSVKAQSYAAGITVGTSEQKRAPQISDCYNIGVIEAQIYAAGIACVALTKSWQEGDPVVTKSVSTSIKNCVSTDTATATVMASAPICTYFDASTPSAIGCKTVSEYYVRCGAFAYEHSTAFCQDMQKDEYPLPIGANTLTLYKRQSTDGYVYYANEKSSVTHSTHVNENADCRCDVCAYTYSENHVNEDGDCLCDICGEGDGTSHKYTSGGICSSCGEIRDSVAGFAAGSILLSDKITLALYMKLSPAVAANPAAYAKIKLGSTTIEKFVSDAERSGEYFVFYINIDAKKMNDEVKIQLCGITSGNGEIFTYSVAAYLDALDKYDPTLSEVTCALRLWGGSAQTADGYNVNDLISEGLTVPDVALPEGATTVTEGAVEGLTHKSTSIAISERLTLRFVFTGVEGVDFLVDGKKIYPTVVSEKLGTYAVEISGISIDELEREFTLVALKDGEKYTVTHSLAAEICKRIRGGNSEQKHIALYRSILNLCDVLANVPRDIIYEMNGGSIETDVTSYGKDAPTALPTEGFSYKIGDAEQRFIGWFADEALTVPITEIPTNSIGAFRVYAKWSLCFASLGFGEDKVYSDGQSESVSVDGVTYKTSEGSGAGFASSGGVLAWSAAAGGSSIEISSAIGALVDNLPEDGYVSYAFTLKNIAMAARFGIKTSDGLFFEFFRTTADGKIFVGEQELVTDGEFFAVLSIEESSLSFYGKDGVALCETRLSAAYNSTAGVLLSACKGSLTDVILTVIGDSAGSIGIDGVSVTRGHAFKLHYIDYVLNGGSFVEGAVYPENYATEGEPTELPSAELLTKSTDGGSRRYLFGGWYADSELTVPIDSISIYNYGIVKVYAKWNILFLDIDYGDGAYDPNVFEGSKSSSGNGLSYGVYGGLGTYDVLTDENGDSYLLAATEKNGSQITGTVTSKFADITSSDLSISFEITIAANGSNLVRPREEIDGEIVEYTDVIDESNLTDTYIRLRAPINGKNTDLVYVFKMNTQGVITMGGKEIGRLDLESPTPVTLRIAVDFKNGQLVSYDAEGNILVSAPFSLSNANTYEQMLRLLTGECFCMRLNTDNSAIRIYDIKVVESNIFKK